MKRNRTQLNQAQQRALLDVAHGATSEVPNAFSTNLDGIGTEDYKYKGEQSR